MAKPYGRIYNNNKNVSITPLDIKDLYPVGSIYLTVSDIYPGDYFGGTWVKMSGGFLYGSVSSAGGTGNGTGTVTNAATGNTGSTTLTINQIPSHNHYTSQVYGAGGSGIDFSVGTTKSERVESAGNYWWNWTHNTGGGQGHTHNLNNHTHNIPYIGVWVWKRTA